MNAPSSHAKSEIMDLRLLAELAKAIARIAFCPETQYSLAVIGQTSAGGFWFCPDDHREDP